MESARGCWSRWRSRVWPKRSLSPVGGGPVGSAGDGFDAQGAHVLHQAAGDSAPAGVEGRAVVGQQALGHAPGGYALVEDVDGRLTGLARGDQGGHRQAGVVVLELEDHRLAPAGQDVLGGVELPAGVGGGVDEPAPRRPRSLGRFGPGHPLLTEDPGQGRRRGRLEAHGGHLVVHADRTVVQSRALQSRAHIEGPGANPIGQAARAGARTARPGLEHRRGPLLQRAPAQDVERLAGDALLGAERRHRPAGRVIGPSGDRQTDTGINTAVLIGAHPSIPNHECHHQDPPNRHRCPDTELSPMS